jgi:glycosyltransferase involved in cell wall biosynthesis
MDDTGSKEEKRRHPETAFDDATRPLLSSAHMTMPNFARSNDPWLSILLPVFNVEPWLRQCLDSILSQPMLAEVEVLLLDDASTDGSLAICEEYRALHPDTLRVFSHSRNTGVSVSRNDLLDVARGRYVWFVDPDDAMQEGALAALRAIVLQHSPDMILCDYRTIGEDGRRGGRYISTFKGPTGQLLTDREALLQGLFARGRMHAWTKVARRRLWSTELRYPVGRYFQDIHVSSRLCLRAQSFYHCQQPWMNYRERPGSAMSSNRRWRADAWFDVRKNDDLAVAMHGYWDQVRAVMPEPSVRSAHSISAFCSRKFTQIGSRLLVFCLRRDGWRAAQMQLRRYRLITESASPLPFWRVSLALLMRGNLRRGLELAAFVTLSMQWTLRQSGSPVLAARQPAAHAQIASGQRGDRQRAA